MISLEKRTEDAHGSLVNLLKTQQSKGIDLGELTAQVELVVDYSGSMKKRLRPQGGEPSEVQVVVERALALALSGLDDDGVVPVRFFQDFVFDPVMITRDNYRGFVDEWTKKNKTGGTNFVPAMRAVLDAPPRKRSLRDRLFGRKQEQPAEADLPPKLVLFVTDGAPNDRKQTVQLIKECADRPVFWQFIALGHKADYVRNLDTMEGRVLDNVGVVEWEQTQDLSDSAFFDAVITEFFTQWLPEARAKGITRV
ncbi:vWA domain-containing protein [Jatrophihabitans fulvus]